MSTCPGTTLEEFIAWNYDLVIEGLDGVNPSLDIAEALGNIPKRKQLSKEAFGVIIKTFFEPYRKDVENALDNYDEDDSGSWRDYSGVVSDCIPDNIYELADKAINVAIDSLNKQNLIAIDNGPDPVFMQALEDGLHLDTNILPVDTAITDSIYEQFITGIPNDVTTISTVDSDIISKLNKLKELGNNNISFVSEQAALNNVSLAAITGNVTNTLRSLESETVYTELLGTTWVKPNTKILCAISKKEFNGIYISSSIGPLVLVNQSKVVKANGSYRIQHTPVMHDVILVMEE